MSYKTLAWNTTLYFSHYLVPTGIYLTGCSKVKEEVISKVNENLEYLSISKSSLEKNSFTDFEKTTFSKAIQRMDKYIVLTNTEFILNVKSGNKIGMSEDLFEYCKSLKDNKNKMIANHELTISGGKLYSTNAPFVNLNKIPRLKNGTEGITPVGTITYTNTWYGYSVFYDKDILHTIALGATAGASVAGIAAVCSAPSGLPALAFGASAAGLGAVAITSEILSEYTEGITIRLMLIVIPIPPFVSYVPF